MTDTGISCGYVTKGAYKAALAEAQALRQQRDELLELLKAGVELRRMDEATSSCVNWPKWVAEAEAAIAKAEGAKP